MTHVDKNFVEHLICPACGERLTCRPEETALDCAACGAEYPVREGIPRFVEAQHLASFSLQWNRYEVAHDDEDRATFAAKTGFAWDDLKCRRVLDAGCGGGRYSKLLGEAGATVVAADMSTAVDKAAHLCLIRSSHARASAACGISGNNFNARAIPPAFPNE